MTKKEIKAAIEDLNVTDNFRELVVLNEIATREKYIIKTVVAMTADNYGDEIAERLDAIVYNMSKIRVGSVISNYIRVMQANMTAHTDNHAYEKPREKEIASIDAWITSVRNNYRDLICCASTVHEIILSGKSLTADGNIKRIKQLEDAVNAVMQITTLRYVREKIAKLSDIIAKINDMLPHADLMPDVAEPEQEQVVSEPMTQTQTEPTAEEIAEYANEDAREYEELTDESVDDIRIAI